ncbi:MAG: DUF1801 domain-containing protein [Sandaracinaceae bacterium]|nr:DUF1801 domain-containing protein [Sandaracinaceae bacterium]
MPKAQITTVAQYVAAQPASVRSHLKLVRATIRKAIPRADESISYQIATYKLKGERVIYFAGWTNHYAVYPAGDALLEAFKKELAAYKVSKGTIRFPISEPVPTKLIERIAKFKLKEAESRLKARAKRVKKRKA